MTDPTPPVPFRPLLVTALVALVAGAGASLATLALVGPEPVPAGAGPGTGGTIAQARPATADDDPGTTDAIGAADATGAPDGAPLARDLAALRAALETAEAERSQLAGTLLALNRRSEALEKRVAALASRAERTSTSPVPDDGAPLPSGADGEIIVSGEPADVDDRAARGAQVDAEDGLLAAGLDPQSAAEIRRRRDTFELARLELYDRATREGWLDSERFGDELEALEGSRPNLREELGDEAYDRYLFARGGSNRIGIESVIGGSPADLAGLQRGDVVLSYAGGRVFRPRELRTATRQGSRGETVQLSVLRGGEIVAVDVPRGPLGVTLDEARLPPG